MIVWGGSRLSHFGKIFHHDSTIRFNGFTIDNFYATVLTSTNDVLTISILEMSIMLCMCSIWAMSITKIYYTLFRVKYLNILSYLSCFVSGFPRKSSNFKAGIWERISTTEGKSWRLLSAVFKLKVVIYKIRLNYLCSTRIIINVLCAILTFLKKTARVKGIDQSCGYQKYLALEVAYLNQHKFLDQKPDSDHQISTDCQHVALKFK